MNGVLSEREWIRLHKRYPSLSRAGPRWLRLKYEWSVVLRRTISERLVRQANELNSYGLGARAGVRKLDPLHVNKTFC